MSDSLTDSGSALDDYVAGFAEEPGYLDFAMVGPLSAAVLAESQALTELLAKARYGSIDTLLDEDDRVRRAASAATGFAPDQISFQTSTTMGIMHAAFGLTGSVLLSPAEFPSLPFAAQRAAEALHAVQPVWLETGGGPVTPAEILSHLDDSISAVAVSLVDSRTGYLADLDGIRQVIGDRLLIVDAVQGFGVVDAPYEVADVVATGGQKWLRAGWGTGFLALSPRAIDHLTPVFSGFAGTEADPYDAVSDPARSALAFTVNGPDRIAQARLATALDEVAAVGVGVISAAQSERVDQVLALADEFALPVVSPRPAAERAGIVVLQPSPERLTGLVAALHNHGVSTTHRGSTVRLSVHAGTSDETVSMLRAAFTEQASLV